MVPNSFEVINIKRPLGRLEPEIACEPSMASPEAGRAGRASWGGGRRVFPTKVLWKVHGNSWRFMQIHGDSWKVYRDSWKWLEIHRKYIRSTRSFLDSWLDPGVDSHSRHDRHDRRDRRAGVQVPLAALCTWDLGTRMDSWMFLGLVRLVEVFHKWGYPIKWMVVVRERSIYKWNDLGGTPFLESPMCESDVGKCGNFPPTS